MTITNRLRQLREAKGLERYDVSVKVRVDTDTVRRWEDGTTQIPVKHLPALMQLFGVTADYLLGLDREPERTA